MFRKSLASVAFVLLLTSAVAAADLNGVWKGKVDINGQMMDFVYTLKADKDKVTGTVETPRGKLEIADGKITGDSTFTFTTSRDGSTFAHEGKLADGKLTIKVHAAAGDREYALSRVVDAISGAWKTKISIPGGGDELELKYQLKVDGEKLTGSVESQFGTLELEEGKASGDAISYKLTIGDNKVSYEGKLADGKINVKSRGGPFGDREYVLTRLVNAAGSWDAKFAMQDGNEIPLHFELKVDGEKLTGAVESPDRKVAISNGKINGDEISFDVDIDGNVIKHNGKISGDEIKLKVNGFDNQWDLTMKRAAK